MDAPALICLLCRCRQCFWQAKGPSVPVLLAMNLLCGTDGRFAATMTCTLPQDVSRAFQNHSEGQLMCRQPFF